MYGCLRLTADWGTSRSTLNQPGSMMRACMSALPRTHLDKARMQQFLQLLVTIVEFNYDMEE